MLCPSVKDVDCPLLLDRSSSTPESLAGKGSPAVQDRASTVIFGQELCIPCMMEEIALLIHFTDEETEWAQPLVEPVMAWAAYPCSVAPDSAALLPASACHRNDKPGQTSAVTTAHRSIPPGPPHLEVSLPIALADSFLVPSPTQKPPSSSRPAYSWLQAPSLHTQYGFPF